MFAGILALVILRTPMNPLAVLVLCLMSIFFAVAPIYWIVMPRLSTGLGLLGLVFVYSFVFGYLGGRSPALKSGPLIMFVTTTGISNQQSYSFEGMVDGALMILLAGTIVTVAYYVFGAIRPEEVLLRSLCRFFRACARVTGGFALGGFSERSKVRRLRKRYFESMLLPTPARIATAQKNLDYTLFPDNSPEIVQRLHGAVQDIVYRLESLELANDRMARHSTELPELLGPVVIQVRGKAQYVFESWARLETGNGSEERRRSLRQCARGMQQQLDALTTDRDRDFIDDQLLIDLYAMLGSIRGMVEAMSDASDVIEQINWRQWATTRF